MIRELLFYLSILIILINNKILFLFLVNKGMHNTDDYWRSMIIYNFIVVGFNP